MAISKTAFGHNSKEVISQIKIGTGEALPIHDSEVDALVEIVDGIDDAVKAAKGVADQALANAATADGKADNAAQAAQAAQATATEAKTTADQNKKDLGTLQSTVENIQSEVTSNKLTVTDSKSGTQFVTHIKEEDGVISSEKATITAAMVTTTQNTNVETWLAQLDAALEEIVGEDSDAITNLKALYDEIKSGTGIEDTIIDWVATAKKTGATDLVDYVTKQIAAHKTAADELYATKNELGTAKTELKGTYASAKAEDETVAGAKKYADSKADAAKEAAIAAAESFVGNQGFATTADVNSAKNEAISTVQGSSSDNKDSKTIEGAKKYAKDYADGLAGNYAAKVHGHDETYAKLDHIHSEYAAKNHTHTVTNGGWNISAVGGILTFTQVDITVPASV